MKVHPTTLPGVVVIEPAVFRDDRGFFWETHQQRRYREILGVDFVQDNHSHSIRSVLRGLHYQLEQPQGKLVWVVSGDIFDVAVDLRRDAATFGQWTAVHLRGDEPRQLYVPPGFAHGFCVLSTTADVLYKCTELYNPQSQFTLRWNDETIGIDWPIDNPLLSEKDQRGLSLGDATYF